MDGGEVGAGVARGGVGAMGGLVDGDGVGGRADEVWARSRGAGDLGTEPGVVEVTVGSLNAAGGDAAVTAWLAAHDGVPPPALFCVNDLVALGALRALRRCGIDVPAGCAVVGYDDVEFVRELAVPLTSVRQPMYEMGARATGLLAAAGEATGGSSEADGVGGASGAGGSSGAGGRAATRTSVEHVLFQPELIARNSTLG
jgi:hypothetical protein